MAFVYMPRKAGLLWMLVLGAIVLPDGIVKKNLIEILVAVGTLSYAIVSLVNDSKKKKQKQKQLNK